MLKNSRQLRILDLIESEQIRTQQELLSRLKSSGFRVTQATVSRDIKSLGLVKISCNTYEQKYTLQTNDVCFPRLSKVTCGGIIEVTEGSNVVFVKTSAGCGKLAKQYLSNILGDDSCILCDDNSAVVFVFNNQSHSVIMSKIKRALNI